MQITHQDQLKEEQFFPCKLEKHNIGKEAFTFPSILSSRPTGSKNFRSTWIGQTCPNKKAISLTASLCQKHNLSKEHYPKR